MITLLPETPEAVKARLEAAVQNFLDFSAQMAGYDSILSAASYAATPNQWQAEGAAFLKWRADVWTHCYTVLADVQAGRRAIPTEAELIAELPRGPRP